MLGHAPLSTNPLSAFRALRSASITGTGGVQASGAATAKRGRVLTASGGLLASGAATVKRGATRTASGGLQITGTAPTYRGVAKTGSGGLRLNGSGLTIVFDPDLQATTRAERRRLVLRAESRAVSPKFEKRRLSIQELIP